MSWRSVTPYVPALLWAGAIWLVGGLNTVPGASSLGGGLDKAGHFAAYALLGVLLCRGWIRGGGRGLAALLLVGALVFGALDEVRQSMLAGRSAELADWFADAAGILTGFLIAAFYARPRRRA